MWIFFNGNAFQTFGVGLSVCEVSGDIFREVDDFFEDSHVVVDGGLVEEGVEF